MTRFFESDVFFNENLQERRAVFLREFHRHPAFVVVYLFFLEYFLYEKRIIDTGKQRVISQIYNFDFRPNELNRTT